MMGAGGSPIGWARLKTFRAAAAVVAAWLSCACAARLVPPSAGGPAWTEITTPHFAVRTDLEPEEARSRARDFERFWAVLADVGFKSPEGPAGRLLALCLRDESEYRALGFPGTAGHYAEVRGPYGLGEAAIVMPCGTEDRNETLMHELTHRFVRFHFPATPVWLNEGLAGFYEHTEFEENTVVLGLSPENRWMTNTQALPPGAALRAYEPAEFYAKWAVDNESRTTRALNYLGAWALVHSLLIGDDEMRDRFWRYLRTIASASATSREAWSATFDGHAEQVLEARYLDLARSGTLLTARLPLPRLPTYDLAQRSLGEAEVLAMWSRYRNRDDEEQRAIAEKELADAVRLDPSDVDVRIRLAEVALEKKDIPAAREHLERAARDNPTDSRALTVFLAHVLLELGLAHDGARPLALATELGDKLRRIANSSPSWRILSALELARGRNGDAKDYAERAILSDSSCAHCYELLASSYTLLGKPEQAKRAQRIAAHLRADAGH